jgi:tRNA(Phe) wybutosine-synthesizing methylase Tyw3
MHVMLFTTINDNSAHCNLSSQSKRKGAACPHYLEDACAIWPRQSKKYIFMGHRHFLIKKHPYRAMNCWFNGKKENREAPLHVTGDLVHLKVKDIKTIEELPKLTEKTLGKRKK